MAPTYGFNDMGFPHDDLERNCECVAQAGYDGLEVRVDEAMLADPRHAERVREVAEAYGLQVPSVAASAIDSGALASPDEDRRSRAVERAKRLVREVAADVLDADTVLLVAGSVGPDNRYDRAHECALRSAREVAGAAGDAGVTLAVENIQNDFLTSPLEFADFVATAGEAGPVGAYLDVGNARRYGHPEHWVHILGDDLHRVHVKGHDKADERVTYPLLGDVDWDAVADALEDVGYDAWITQELDAYRSRGERMPATVLDDLRAVFD
jgi:L-ribulose-5-phosphate 3-epimerase